ncbi:NRDE family protein [Chryseobacterium profundimaris]|uniref:Transport and Golgi organisation 2 n=1 Tax=Chryseobacterium profundimaris TaxID=1387275 RepID=A0ABY1PA63_9FLAO|nr:NRDE family protein [Chryseobacterium profundimaris]SMP30015.1 Transport and Golgi organisation 2 [Chryseobacterium profundimaris]
MCTVSYFKTKDSIIFTSNRDEKKSREKALFPNTLELEDRLLYFPKDKKASGTWFAVDDKGNAAILLNGAFQKHTSNPPYKKSRGIVLLDIVKSKNILEAFQEYDMSEIEPFQLLVFSDEKLLRLLWDGNVKHEILLNENENHLLSSKTLYNDSIENEREKDFRRFQINRNIESGEILNFHKKHQIEKEPEIDVSIKEEFLTVSITQLIIRKDKIHFAYHDLTENTIQHTKIERRSFV